MESIKAHKKKIIIGLILIALPALLAFTYYYGRSRSTENAYINADVVNVAAQVSGRVTAVHIRDNQHVHKGDPLFDIDPEPFEIALSRAQAASRRAWRRSSPERATAARARFRSVDRDPG